MTEPTIKLAAQHSLSEDVLPKLISLLKAETLDGDALQAAAEECVSLLELVVSSPLCATEAADVASQEPAPAEAEAVMEASEDMSDADAMAMLEAMDGPAEPEPAAAEGGEISDDDAMALLEAMDGPAEGGDDTPMMAADTAEPEPDTSGEDASGDEESAEVGEIEEWVANDFQTDPDMVKDFIENSDELMENLNEQILRLEDNPTDKEIIEEIFRSAHTLKGAAGMFGFAAIERIVHKMESLFDLVRKDKLVPNSDIIDVVFQGIDILNPLLEAVKDGKPCGTPTAKIVGNLVLAVQGKYVKSEASAAQAPASPQGGGVDAPEAKKPEGGEAKKSAKANAAASTIRVDLNRLDDLVNLIGELVTDRTRFTTVEEQFRTQYPGEAITANFSESVQLFGRHMNEIQEIIMKVRMVPIGNAFNKFTRIVRDLSRSLGKEIDLRISGENAELDKTLVEQIGDPLIHLIRNSCDHGVELPEVREQAGKSRTGLVELAAQQDGNFIVITIRDDGKGMDPEVFRKKGIEKGLIKEDDKLEERDLFNLIFEAGFSTAEKITNVSGRGVGMDVVKRQILKLKGMIEIDSKKGFGSTITIRLPLTLAIVQSLLVGTKSEKFAIPLSSVQESIRIKPSDIQKVGDVEVIKLRDKVLPLLHLDSVLSLERKKGTLADFIAEAKEESGAKPYKRKSDRLFVVVVGQKDRPFGLVVDTLLNQQEMVIKSMGKLMKNIPCVAGGAVMGNGEVVLVLDIPEMEYTFSNKTRTTAA